MKQVTRKGVKVPVIKLRLSERDIANGITLNIEILPARNHSPNRSRRRRRGAYRNHSPSARYAARPVVGYMNIIQKIAVGRRVYVHMLNNEDFTNPSPAPWVLQQVTEDLNEAYYNAFHGQDRDKEILGRKEKYFDEIYLQIEEYVDKIAKGSADVYHSAGIEPMLVYHKRRISE